MLRPSLEASEAEILAFAREWIRLAANSGLDLALAELDARGSPPWTPELFEEVTFNHFDDGNSCVITSPDEVEGLRVDAYKYNDGSGFAVDHDLALNGQKSDLTAQFDFRKGKDCYLVYLESFHVL